ncbi:hypothetical protein PV325_005552, partial [Microctonus aethiopoides]
FHPHENDLGGCDLLVMVQTQFLLYVVSKDDGHQNGIAGELMRMLGISMKFTPKYVWSSMVEDFFVGMSQVTFIVPINKKRELTKGKLLLPFDSLVWVFTLRFGLLMSVGVGTFPNFEWMRIFS